MKRYVKHPVGAHYGLRDWLLQRLTAVIMAAYTVMVVITLVGLQPLRLTHANLVSLMSGGFVRVATMLFFVALLYHAWVGLRDILMDYVKPMWVRLTLQAIVGQVLVGYLLWTAAILWGGR